MPRELVVLSHLRWTFVWQRPQQLVSRVSNRYDRVWFVEEPNPVVGMTEPVLRTERHADVVRVWLDTPADGRNGSAGFEPEICDCYASELSNLLPRGGERDVWLYTPMAMDLARALRPSLLIYDVMDDLAAFRFAPQSLVLR